jgi:membrane-associated phospholipid phosphatase
MAVFTSVAVCMFLINKKAGIIFSIFAIFIGLSRIIIGVHYPFDIFGGLAVGLIISLITSEIFKKV